MAFTPNIPAATDKINVSQPQIQANFNALVPFSEGYANLNFLGSAPTFAADFNGIYNLANADTGKKELYVHKQLKSSTTDIPFTASRMSKETFADSVNGWSYLPSGLLMKWGNAAFTSSTSIDVNPTDAGKSGGPDFTKVFKVYLTKQCPSGSLATYFISLNGVLSDTTGNFRVRGTGTASGCSFDYLVIGV